MDVASYKLQFESHISISSKLHSTISLNFDLIVLKFQCSSVYIVASIAEVILHDRNNHLPNIATAVAVALVGR